MNNTIFKTIIATNTLSTSEPVQVPEGYTLTGIEIPVELVSTAFYITHSKTPEGNYVTFKDPLGIYTTSAGSTINFIMGETSLGIFNIPPALSATLSSNLKIILNTEESGAITLTFRNIA